MRSSGTCFLSGFSEPLFTEDRLVIRYSEFVGVENGELGFYSGEGA